MALLGFLGLLALRATRLPLDAMVPQAALSMAVAGGPALGFFVVAIDLLCVFGLSAEVAGGGLALLGNISAAFIAQVCSDRHAVEFAAGFLGLALAILTMVRLPARSDLQESLSSTQTRGISSSGAI